MLVLWGGKWEESTFGHISISFTKSLWPFNSNQRGPYRGIVLGSLLWLKGKFFTMSRVLDVLQMKEENVLKFFATEPTLVTPTLTSKWESTLSKGKMMASPFIYEENLGETSAGSLHHCCHWKTGWCQCHVIKEYWPVSFAKLLLPLEPLLIRPLHYWDLHWSGTSGSYVFWWLLIPELTISLS